MRVSDMARYAQYLRVLRLFYPPPRHTNTKTYFTRMSRAFPAKKDLIPQEFQIFRFFGPTRRGIGHPIPYRSPRPRWPRQGGSRRTFFKSEPRGGVVWWFRGLDVDVLTLCYREMAVTNYHSILYSSILSSIHHTRPVLRLLLFILPLLYISHTTSLVLRIFSAREDTYPIYTYVSYGATLSSGCVLYGVYRRRHVFPASLRIRRRAPTGH